MSNPNYCQHPECHNSHVAWYVSDEWSRTFWIWLTPTPGAKRWCRSHALINLGVAFG